MTVTETMRYDRATKTWAWYKPEDAPEMRARATDPDIIVKGDLNSVLHSAPKGMFKGTPQAAEHYDEHNKPCFNSRAKLREFLAREQDSGDTTLQWDGEL